MTMSYNETKHLIDLVLNESIQDARLALNLSLKEFGRTEPEFCMGVVEHGEHLPYSSEQWVEFLVRVPNRLFEHEHWLLNKLTFNQRQKLGFY